MFYSVDDDAISVVQPTVSEHSTEWNWNHWLHCLISSFLDWWNECHILCTGCLLCSCLFRVFLFFVTDTELVSCCEWQLIADGDVVTADMLVANDVATGTAHSRADGRTDVADDNNDEDSFEQLFEQLRIMKGCCLLLLQVLWCSAISWIDLFHTGVITSSLYTPFDVFLWQFLVREFKPPQKCSRYTVLIHALSGSHLYQCISPCW